MKTCVMAVQSVSKGAVILETDRYTCRSGITFVLIAMIVQLRVPAHHKQSQGCLQIISIYQKIRKISRGALPVT
jgi:hypothetical protein